MAIKRIRVCNFKSFRELDVELGAFNVLIGANASGKSNFVQILAFLRDLVNDGLENAVSMQGGMGYLRNLSVGSRQPVTIEAVFEQRMRHGFPGDRSRPYVTARTSEATYRLALADGPRGREFGVSEDVLVQKCEFVPRVSRPRGSSWTSWDGEPICEGTTTIRSVGREVVVEVQLPEDAPFKQADLSQEHVLYGVRRLPANAVVLSKGTRFECPSPFGDMRIYDFDPRLPKRAVPITGKAELEEDGSNLALALRHVLQSRTRRRMFLNLVKDLLPFVDSLAVERFTDKSALFFVRESFFKRRRLPGALVSDGTVGAIALVLALYFQDAPVVVIEEPERNIHPHLIARVVNMMEDASRHKQIIVTTHSPELVKHAEADSLLLVSRDKEGSSTICRPAKKAAVQTFLKNEVGIDELYVQNLLEWPA